MKKVTICPPWRTVEGLVTNEGKTITISSTRLAIIVGPERYLNYPAGVYGRSDAYGREQIEVGHV